MSLPRMCSLPSSSGSSSSSSGDVDREKQRFAAAAAAAATMTFPGLPFMAAAFPAVTCSGSGSSVFPNQMAAQLSLFNPHLQQYYANFLHQQQLLQSLQNHSPQPRTDLSPSVSDGRASSHVDSPLRKLQIDEDGNPICIICDEKLSSEHDWTEHIELERSKLIKNIAGLKEQKSQYDGSLVSPTSEQCRRKREYDLLRIRSNQQKRLGGTIRLKNRVWREDFNSNQLNRPTNSASSQMILPNASTESVKKDVRNEQLLGNNNFCRFCERHREFLVISNSFDHPRCHDCFLKLRSQTNVLPLSVTSPVDCSSPSGLSDGTSGKASSPHSPLSLVVEQKRSRTE